MVRAVWLKCMPGMPSSALRTGQGHVSGSRFARRPEQLCEQIARSLACGKRSCYTAFALLPSWSWGETTPYGCSAMVCLKLTSECTHSPSWSWTGRRERTFPTCVRLDRRCSNSGTGQDDWRLPCSYCSWRSSRAPLSRVGSTVFGVSRSPRQSCWLPQHTRRACRTTDRTRFRCVAAATLCCTQRVPWALHGFTTCDSMAPANAASLRSLSGL